ncbi:MAG: type II secretion system protein M [Burkholderiales bacterium]|jgi:general secretion pathway protein M|uniref:type II secretion system protein GspM n=1 Tax=Limnobacter sp. TaxID=2003368 RepID=UPI0039BD0A22|nr:type II secretion system protein M [Burkholderiales bacterium]
MKANHLLNQANAWLDQLNSRERKLVTYGGTLAAVLVTWFVLIEPAMLTIQQGPANQAALVDKAGQVMRAAQDLDALRGARSRVVVPESDLQARLQQLLDEQGIAEQASLLRTEEGDIRVEFNNVPASGFLAWLARAEAISSVVLNLAELEKVEAGVLKGYVTLLPSSQGNTGTPP